MDSRLSEELVRKMDAYWRAANYLSVGQIYLLANPLLRDPLRLEDVKPRLLGHFGTTPGLNFIYVHMNRAIVERDLDAILPQETAGPIEGERALSRARRTERTRAAFNRLDGRGCPQPVDTTTLKNFFRETWAPVDPTFKTSAGAAAHAPAHVHLHAQARLPYPPGP